VGDHGIEKQQCHLTYTAGEEFANRRSALAMVGTFMFNQFMKTENSHTQNAKQVEET
jgi:hypothetical protein